MSEIIPKERLLKNVRKALISPSQRPFVNLDFDSGLYNQSAFNNPNHSLQHYTKLNNTFFKACNNKYEFLLQYIELAELKAWKDPVCHNSTLVKLLEDNGVGVQVNSPTNTNPLIATFNKMNNKPSLMFFDLRYHFIRKVLEAPVLIIVASESQIADYSFDKKYTELSPLDNTTKCSIVIDELIKKETYLFIVKDEL